jgi:hypothetical protein
MTKQEVLSGLKKCAKKLGRTPTMREMRRMMKISEHNIRFHYKNLRSALREAGLDARAQGFKVNLVRLLEDWAQVARKLGHPPTCVEYRKAGEFADSTLILRCGAWSRLGARFRALAKEQKMESEWADVLAMIARWEGATTVAGRRRMQAQSHATAEVAQPNVLAARRIKADRPIYGPPSSLRGMRYDPVNEQGVVYVFGRVADKLGFEVERIQTAFPDCEAMREVAPGKWQREKVEFELFSRNFLEHQHDPKGCDIIVCWVHNWPECPEWIEVIELSKVVKQIG